MGWRSRLNAGLGLGSGKTSREEAAQQRTQPGAGSTPGRPCHTVRGCYVTKEDQESYLGHNATRARASGG